MWLGIRPVILFIAGLASLLFVLLLLDSAKTEKHIRAVHGPAAGKQRVTDARQFLLGHSADLSKVPQAPEWIMLYLVTGRDSDSRVLATRISPTTVALFAAPESLASVDMARDIQYSTSSIDLTNYHYDPTNGSSSVGLILSLVTTQEPNPENR